MPETPAQYYQRLKALAMAKRELYKVETSKINLTLIRSIYKSEGVKIDYWVPKGRKIKACYFADGEPSVMVDKNLPNEPKIFALVHELKHHWVDRDAILDGVHKCGAYDDNNFVEIGAEVFAAQFIYPDTEMLTDLENFGVPPAACTPEHIVRFKSACPAPVSYTFLVKRFERFKRIEVGSCKKVQFKKLEEQIFGTPVYKRPSFIKNRKKKRT